MVKYENQPLYTLVGMPLKKVNFVMDYVEFHFTELVLTAYCNPFVRSKGVKFQFPEIGSHKALVSLLGQEVTKIFLDEDKEITMSLDSGTVCTIPFELEKGHIMEFAVLQSVKSGLNMGVW